MSLWRRLVADNGRFCPCRIEVKSTEAETLTTAHIERIASALGKSTSVSDRGTVWENGKTLLSRKPLAEGGE